MNAANRLPATPRSLAFRTLSGWLAFGIGAGLAPVAPGTAGSAAALLLAVPLTFLPPTAFWIVWLAAWALGVWCCGVTSRRLAVKDPGAIVWDEIVAMWLVLGCMPAAWPWWLAAFGVFRFFDIAKPWPIRALERRIGGGVGIMLDDVLAAGYALLLLIPARLVLQY